MKKRWKRNENGSTLVELMTAFLILLLVAEAMLLSVSGYSKTVKRYRGMCVMASSPFTAASSST